MSSHAVGMSCARLADRRRVLRASAKGTEERCSADFLCCALTVSVRRSRVHMRIGRRQVLHGNPKVDSMHNFFELCIFMFDAAFTGFHATISENRSQDPAPAAFIIYVVSVSPEPRFIMFRSARLVTLLAAAFFGRIAAAQQFAVAGTVHDSAGAAVRELEVVLEPGARATRTDDRGAFNFSNVPAGTYTLSVRRPGYRPLSREITVDQDLRLELTITRAIVLPATITSVSRLGLSGVIEDAQHHPLGGARLNVVGAAHEVTTDSAGAFYADVRPGRYLVRVSREGYADRMVGVRVPPDSGRRIVVSLSRGEPESPARESAALFDLHQRMIRTPGPLHFFTREELMKRGVSQLNQVVGHAAAHPVDESCQAEIGDESYSMPLWTIDVSDIEFLEVNPRTPSSVGTSLQRSGACPLIIAWLRK